MRLLIALLILLGGFGFAQDLKVMTFNIRLHLDSDKENSWTHRKPEVLQLLDYYAPEVFGVQEALPLQMKDLESGLSDYDYVGVGRDDGKDKGEYSAIFFNKEKLKLLKSGTFWLSETSAVPSKGWDAALKRICTYALFKNKKGKKFWVFNTHFDHIGIEARKNSANLILKKIKEFNKNDFPVVLAGDFNLTEDSEPIKMLSDQLKDTFYHSLKKPYGPKGTFTAFDINKVSENRIDYIFVKDFKVNSYRTINDKRQNLLYPSDHFPILVELKFQK